MSDTKVTTLFSLAAFKGWASITSTATKAISTLTSVGLVATAVCANHGYQTGTLVSIAGAAAAAYNGSTVVTVIDPNTFTYPLATAAASPDPGTPTATLDDARLIEIADAASEEMENETGWVFVARTKSVLVDGNGKIAQATGLRPILSISTFTINGAAVDPTTYVVDARTGIITFPAGPGFSCGTKNVAITALVGFGVQDSPDLPRDVYRAGLDLAKAIKDQLTTNAIAASSVNLGPAGMVIVPSAFPKSVQRVIDRWADTQVLV